MADVTKMNKSSCVSISIIEVSQLQPGVVFAYPLKTSGNIGFPDVFRGYRKATPVVMD